MDALETWENGAPLSEAYDDYSDPIQRDKFRRANTPGAIAAFKGLMYAELFESLSREEFIAFGFRNDLPPEAPPAQVPAHWFKERPKVEDCDCNVIVISGWRYERVKIVKVAYLPQLPTPTFGQPTHVPKVGRPKTEEAALTVLRLLHDKNPTEQLPPASRLLERFNALYPDQARSMGLQCAPLSERKLRDHLKIFRQQLANSSNNNFAN